MTRILLLLSMITLAVGSVTAQTADKAEIERLRAELARLTAENALLKIRPEYEKLFVEARALYEQGKYREAKAKMVPAYAAFERLPVKDRATRVRYLRRLCNISDALQESDKSIEYAIEVSIHARDDDDRGFAYNNLGLAYGNKGEYDKAIGYFEKSLAIDLKTLGPEHPDAKRTNNNLAMVRRRSNQR